MHGLIHVYTGEGKGKTTCGVGLALRSLGHDHKVVYAHFHKRPEKYGYNEINMLEKNGATIFGFAGGTPLFDKTRTDEDLVREVAEGIQTLRRYLATHQVDLLVMDEINISVASGWLKEAELLQFMADKPANLELVLTGRYAAEGVRQAADYVSVIQKEKHPFDAGVPSRKGIEF